ncbi:MAG: nuclear transport factor 2 family protein [Pseudonocardiaceae bacterium]
MSQQIQDRLDVIDICTRMAWHTDRRQWDALVEVFTEEVMLDYTSLAGGRPARVDRDALVGSWRELLNTMTATQHLLGNHLVTVDGDVAECTAQFQATHLADLAPGEDRWILGGHYQFGLVRVSGQWRISSVTMKASWSSGNQAILGGAGAAAEADRADEFSLSSAG